MARPCSRRKLAAARRGLQSRGPRNAFTPPAYEATTASSSCRLRSRRHPLRVAILPLGKEIGEFVADDLRLTEHGMPPRFEADKPRAGDALRRAFTRFVRGELVVFGVDDQDRYADLLQLVVVDIRVGYEEVEVVTLGAHGEQT